MSDDRKFQGLGHSPIGVPRAMLTFFPRSCAKQMGENGQRTGVPSRNNRTGYANVSKSNKQQKKPKED